MGKKHDILQPSGYDERNINSNSEVFVDKKPIKTTGTTCDAFSARFESRRVFVKQLKPEYAFNSRYRQAFQKEYELGVSIRHPSIPQYIKFTDDTLITEFVDGKTLHQMIQDSDPRLHSNRNIEKWVRQLLDVMDYLHARNVIHCDIKTDNIMITNDTRNLMLIDFDKAFTASQDLTSGTPLNFGSEEENLTKRQMDIRCVRNIIEKLLQYVDTESLKERMVKVVAMAGSPEVTIPELLEVWKQSEEKVNSKRINAGWWIGGIIFIALFVIIWSYLPKESSEVIQPQDIPNVENPEMNISDETKEETKISTIEKIFKEEEKEIPEYPDWNSLLITDVVSMNKLLDKISNEIQTGRIRPDSVANIVLLINDETNSLHEKVMNKYSSKFPELSQLKLIEGIYESDPVKLLVKRRDEILQRLIEVQQNETDEEISVSKEMTQKLESQLEKDLAEYIDFLLVLKESLDSTGTTPYGRQNSHMKITNFEIDFDHKILIDYPKIFPSLSNIEIHDMAVKTPVVEKMVKLRDTVIELLDK
ncbi:MAG: protein kinase [Muribaculaceae bacterium]|nr:protein kinase [Muribaculaceae bacterium]